MTPPETPEHPPMGKPSGALEAVVLFPHTAKQRAGTAVASGGALFTAASAWAYFRATEAMRIAGAEEILNPLLGGHDPNFDPNYVKRLVSYPAGPEAEGMVLGLDVYAVAAAVVGALVLGYGLRELYGICGPRRQPLASVHGAPRTKAAHNL
ncbi:MAG TPA: hypothetical protein DHU69_06470 [Deltaproteobacteria bacterium]|nr:hypothetical protein [Deltaproteobacteria bacterium]